MMADTWPYPGARWWKFDFHTHTPTSHDTYWFTKKQLVTHEQWLLNYMAAGIDCVAVTDHNSGEWIDPLKAAYAQMLANPPAGFRELAIFPGVEISANGGVHLLAIFDTTATTGDIDGLLGRVQYNGTKGDSDSETVLGLSQVIEAVLALGAVPIPAHADDPKGLLRVNPGTRECALSAMMVRQTLDVEGLLAVEWCDPAKPWPQAVARAADRLAQVLGSDNHGFPGVREPGSRYSWIKMARPAIEGLRLALLDGNGASVRRSDDAGAFDPFKTPSHFIRSITISNARLIGNGKPEQLQLSPYYNALIGGRGTGKSSVLHTVRLAYRRDDELRHLGETTEPWRRFNSFQRVPKGRDDDQGGALRDDTEIVVELSREDRLHRLRWRYSAKGAAVEDQRDDGTWAESASQAINSERFPIRLFSQGQIAAMAGDNRQALLDVIDAAAEIGELHRTFDDAKRTWLAQRARLRESDGRLLVLPEVERKLAETVRKSEALAQSHHAEVLKAHQAALRQKREVGQTLEQLRAVRGRVDTLREDLLLDDWPADTFGAEGADAEMLAWRQQADKSIEQLRAALTAAAEAFDGQVGVIAKDARLLAWNERMQAAKAAYETLQATLAAQGVSDPQAFGKLVQERQQFETQLKQLKQMEVDRRKAAADADAQWQRVLKARAAITAKRIEFLRDTLQENGFVRMSVEAFGFDPRSIERSLRDVLDVQDDRFENDILHFDNGEPKTGMALEIATAADRRAQLQQVKDRLVAAGLGLGGHISNYLKRKLERPEFADQIQCWFPEDDLRIEYSRAGDGTGWQGITQGSQGQRSAALLAFLLAFGDEPLLLDQPEDDLDNHLIYDLIVKQIRQNKLRRQLVIVTHNPNVVVNGDAEMVHVLDFRAGQCRVTEKGALQVSALRQEVCRVMEGGKEALKRRWRRLGEEV